MLAVASGKTEHTEQVIDSGAVPVLVKLLQSSDPEVRGQAAWGLGNIAGDSPRCRDLVLQAQALPHLLRLLDDSSPVVLQRNATWTVSNLTRGKPPPLFKNVSPALPVLAKTLSSSAASARTLPSRTVSTFGSYRITCARGRR